MTDIFIVAVEPSADSLGAELIDDLYRISPSVTIDGIGGAKMAARDVASNIDISQLAILGLIEGLKAYPIVRKRVAEAVDLITLLNPKSVVLIDSWGFMLRVAWGLRKAGYGGKIIKYVAPQVWAMRAGRAKTLAKAVDHLLSIQPMDAPYFEAEGLPVTYVGNPMFDKNYRSGSAESLRKLLDINEGVPIISVWFGSRPSEIQRLFLPFATSIKNIHTQFPAVKFVSVVSDGVAHDVRQMVEERSELACLRLVSEAEKMNVLAGSTVALACSGTVTTQLASAGVPTVVAYKLHPLTFGIAKHLFKPDYVSLVNIAADQELMPEFIQGDCTPKNLSGAMRKYLDAEYYRDTASVALIKQTNLMRGNGSRASACAAREVLRIIGR